MADFQFPDFGVPGFPYANYVQQLLASLGQGGGAATGSMNIPAGAPQGSAWNPIMQVPPPPVTPGMNLPATPPGYTSPSGPLVNPAGFTGTPGPVPGITPAAPSGAPAPSGGAVSKAPGNNKMATGGLLNFNVSDGITPGIQSTQGLTANDAARFAFTIPQGYSTNGGLGMFSYSPTGDQSMAQRTITFLDANGNPIPGAGRTGIEGGGYFSVGGPALDAYGNPDPNVPVLQPGQTYYANLSGGNGPAGPANVDYGLNLHAGGRQQTPYQRAVQQFQSFHPGYGNFGTQFGRK